MNAGKDQVGIGGVFQHQRGTIAAHGIERINANLRVLVGDDVQGAKEIHLTRCCKALNFTEHMPAHLHVLLNDLMQCPLPQAHALGPQMAGCPYFA